MSDWKRMLKAWAETDEGHARRVHRAREVIADALAAAQQPYVAFSGGKDSTCMLHLILEQAPDTMVLHWDYGPYYVPRWLEAEFIENAQRIGARNIRVETSPEYQRLGRRAINVLGREYLGKLVPQLKAEGYDLAFVGLRAEESLKRKRRISRQQGLTMIRECWPIAEWTWQDVWGYILSHGLPYASVYDRYGPLIGWDRTRLTTFFDPEFDKLGASNVDGVLMWRDRHGPKG